MSASGIASFETAIGTCALAWRDAAVIGLSLPGATDDAAQRRLRRLWPALAPAEPPLGVSRVITAVQDAVSGKPVDLGWVPLEMGSVGAFERSVYGAARAIPYGQTTTYGELAKRVGDVGDARAVGQALGRNPWPIIVPCHRVTAAEGRTGGFSAPGGRATKLRLLEIEGALRAESLPLFAGPQT